MNADAKFEDLKQRMLEKFFEKNPTLASYLGLHDPYDNLLPKGDTQHLANNLKMLEEASNQMKATIAYDDLSEVNKIDWEVIEKSVEMSQFEFHEMRSHELDPDAFGEIGGTFFMMITRNYAPLEKRIASIIARLAKLPQYLEEFRSRFKASQPVKLWTEIAIESAQQIPALFQFVAGSTKGKIPAELSTKLLQAVQSFMPHFKQHMEWLESLKSKTVEEWALGREKFEKLITLRDLGMTSEQIHQIGVKYLKDLKRERAEIATQIAPGKSVEDVLKMIEEDAPKTFEEALNATKRSMEDAKKFIVENGIATVYEEDVLTVEETPAFLAPLIPFAAMMMPSRFDKPMLGVYIVTRPKDTANLGKHLNYASIQNTAVHEAFPGHFLQGTISNRSSIIHIMAQGTETVEGWAHYCEQMMMEHGYLKGLKTRLIQVNDVIWRAVRIIVDVKLSRGEMSVDEAVEMLIKEAAMSKEGAVAEVRRYTQTPSYALSYLLGKHLILQLRETITEQLGSKYSERFFHDTITANGYLPISLLRKVFNRKIAELRA